MRSAPQLILEPLSPLDQIATVTLGEDDISHGQNRGIVREPHLPNPKPVAAVRRRQSPGSNQIVLENRAKPDTSVADLLYGLVCRIVRELLNNRFDVVLGRKLQHLPHLAARTDRG